MRGQQQVYDYLDAAGIKYDYYEHPAAPTIEIAAQYYRGEGTTLCKNLFFRNHKGNKHYLVCFPCDQELGIHELEQRLKATLQSQGLPSCGKLSFASPERMMRYLGLEPGSVSPFGLINDEQHEVHLFLDARLQQADTLSFHPNDCRGTVVITRPDFERYLQCVANTWEYIELD